MSWEPFSLPKLSLRNNFLEMPVADLWAVRLKDKLYEFFPELPHVSWKHQNFNPSSRLSILISFKKIHLAKACGYHECSLAIGFFLNHRAVFGASSVCERTPQ